MYANFQILLCMELNSIFPFVILSQPLYFGAKAPNRKGQARDPESPLIKGDVGGCIITICATQAFLRFLNLKIKFLQLEIVGNHAVRIQK